MMPIRWISKKRKKMNEKEGMILHLRELMLEEATKGNQQRAKALDQILRDLECDNISPGRALIRVRELNKKS
jgi:hypothetical protein